MSIKLLNLDDIVQVEREIRIGGVNYPVAEQTVGQMLSAIKAANSTEEDQTDPEYVLSTMLKHVQEVLPTCPEATLRGLGISGITAILEFVQTPVSGDEEEDAEGNDQKAEAQA